MRAEFCTVSVTSDTSESGTPMNDADDGIPQQRDVERVETESAAVRQPELRSAVRVRRPLCGYSIRQTVTANERKVQLLQLFSDCSRSSSLPRKPQSSIARFSAGQSSRCIHSRASRARKYRLQDPTIQLLILATTKHPNNGRG